MQLQSVARAPGSNAIINSLYGPEGTAHEAATQRQNSEHTHDTRRGLRERHHFPHITVHSTLAWLNDPAAPAAYRWYPPSAATPSLPCHGKANSALVPQPRDTKSLCYAWVRTLTSYNTAMIVRKSIYFSVHLYVWFVESGAEGTYLSQVCGQAFKENQES